MCMARLLAIDGLNIVRRVYEASPEPDTAEKAEIALRHALSSFRKLLGGHAPSHVLAAFDHGGPTWRHALYAGYRAGRAPMPEALRDGLPGFYQRLAGFGVPWPKDKVIEKKKNEYKKILGYKKKKNDR
jgi:protein Xni